MKLRQRPFLAGLFLTTFSTLALEILFTRLLSVLTWYSLAFLVIGMGLCGLTAGAVIVYLRGESADPHRVAKDALWLTAAIPVSYVLLLITPIRIAPAGTTLALFVFFSAFLALPFVPAGMIVATALTRTSWPPGRVYAVDLAGAAAGSACVPLVIGQLGCGGAILFMAVLAAGAAACFAWSASDQKSASRALWAAGAMAVLTMVVAVNPEVLPPLWVKGRPEDRSMVELERWNSHSRIQVSRPMRVAGSLWGAGTRCAPPEVWQRLVVIDGDAATPLYYFEHSMEELGFLMCDVTNLVHAVRPRGSVAIIGVGGSRDIQSALLAGHQSIAGIELNGALLQVLSGPHGHGTGVPGSPSVDLVHDEARSYLAKTHRRFEVIQASLIDTWAATGAGAHALSENGLYTIEAWTMFLERLEPDGILSVSRWSSAETARLVSLASAALLESGAEHPRAHVALASGGQVTTILVAKRPFTSQDLVTLRQAVASNGFSLLASPDMPPGPASSSSWLDVRSIQALERMTLSKTYDLRPPRDDQPFFFNVIRPSAFWATPDGPTAGPIEGNRVATAALVLSLVASVVLSLLAIVLPLLLGARRAGGARAGLWPALSYFALLGLGFMLAEISLLQRLSLVLGHPSYSLMVVLATLVGAAGIGSWLSDKVRIEGTWAGYAVPAGIAVVLGTTAVVLPWAAAWSEPHGTWLRIAMAVALCAPGGVAMGMAFPAGLRIVRQAHAKETPWFWGINGVGSVVASSAAILIALEYGLTALLACASFCYLLLIPVVFLIRRTALAPAKSAQVLPIASENP